jgi:hypothetical protein
MPTFFIFSQVNSGSSWLSVFLTGKDSYCYHEPTADYSISEWKNAASRRSETIVGGVDTGAYYFAAAIYFALPQTRFFSLCRGEIPNTLANLKHDRISYARINDLGYLEELWGELIGTPFDSERAATLIEMRIKRDVDKFYAARPNAIEHFRSLLQ